VNWWTPGLVNPQTPSKNPSAVVLMVHKSRKCRVVDPGNRGPVTSGRTPINALITISQCRRLSVVVIRDSSAVHWQIRERVCRMTADHIFLQFREFYVAW